LVCCFDFLWKVWIFLKVLKNDLHVARATKIHSQNHLILLLGIDINRLKCRYRCSCFFLLTLFLVTFLAFYFYFCIFPFLVCCHFSLFYDFYPISHFLVFSLLNTWTCSTCLDNFFVKSYMFFLEIHEYFIVYNRTILNVRWAFIFINIFLSCSWALISATFLLYIFLVILSLFFKSTWTFCTCSNNFLYMFEQLFVKSYLDLPKNTWIFPSVWKNNFKCEMSILCQICEQHWRTWTFYGLQYMWTIYLSFRHISEIHKHTFSWHFIKINMCLWAACLKHRSVFIGAEMAAPRDARIYLCRCGRSRWVIESLALLFLLQKCDTVIWCFG
jgi:hypothetical protein